MDADWGGPVSDSSDPVTPALGPSRVVLYTRAGCRFCAAAKALLEQRGIAFEEVDTTDNDVALQRAILETGAATLPQLVVDGKPVGGFDEIRALDRSGELWCLIAISAG